MSATIKDIAQRAAVSTATVSKVLNRKDRYIGEETRKKIWAIADELNYRPNAIARSLVMRSTRVIGIVVPDILNAYFTELVRSCDDAARKRGYATILCNSDSDAAKEVAHLNFLASRGVDGIVLAASDLRPDARLLETLAIPAIAMDRDVRDLDCIAARIDTDYEQGAFLAAAHLLSRGHRRIAFISGPLSAPNTRMRLRGYQRAHADYGIPFDQSLIECGEFSHGFGVFATNELLGRTHFSAISCMSDMLALGAMAALRQAGRKVPEDCAVIGFDNIYIAALIARPLSTIERQISESGHIAINALIDRLENPEKPRQTVLMEPSLALRETA